MPSIEEGPLALFRARPRAVAEIARDLFGLDLPAFTRASVVLAEAAAMRGDADRASFVVALDEPQPTMAFLVVRQHRVEPPARQSWPRQLAATGCALGCPVGLLVCADDDEVAAWAGQPLLLPAEERLSPLVVSPAGVPRIRSPLAAIRHPSLALVSAIVHARSPEAEEIALAALVGATAAVGGLTETRRDPDPSAAASGALDLPLEPPTGSPHDDEWRAVFGIHALVTALHRALAHAEPPIPPPAVDQGGAVDAP